MNEWHLVKMKLNNNDIQVNKTGISIQIDHRELSVVKTKVEEYFNKLQYSKSDVRVLTNGEQQTFKLGCTHCYIFDYYNSGRIVIKATGAYESKVELLEVHVNSLEQVLDREFIIRNRTEPFVRTSNNMETLHDEAATIADQVLQQLLL